MYCYQCEWFDTKDVKPHERIDGRCHRMAPIPTCDGEYFMKWPRVERKDWCGEFKKSENRKETQ
uniref:Uncharacterized protein n=1 Tax=viral metagenome TaxID=1070528 RepID=A0A6H1ZQM4_9ZZZZ